MSQAEKKKLHICKDLQARLIREAILMKCRSSMDFFFYVKSIFIELFIFQEISIGKTVNSLSVNVIWNHDMNCL